MQVLGDPLRNRLLLALERHELTVGELCSVVQAPQSTVSRHLQGAGRRRVADLPRGRNQPEVRGRPSPGWTPPTGRSGCSCGRRPRARSRRRKTRGGSPKCWRRAAPAPRSSSGAGASRWDQLRDELFGRRFFVPALLGLLDENAIVADLGCGTGQVAEATAAFVGQVIGVDASPSMLKAAKKRLSAFSNVDLRAGSLEALPIDDDTLDAAMMFLVLHHVNDPARALARGRPGAQARRAS